MDHLGQNSGAKYEYSDPENPTKGNFSDRQFRKASQIRRYAKELDIRWDDQWSGHDKIYWENVPKDITSKIKLLAKTHRDKCIKRKLSPKHKYIYILGRSTYETKILRKTFKTLNPNLANLPYPKIRGPQKTKFKSITNTAAKLTPPKENILTVVSENDRPQGQREDSQNSSQQFLTIKEAATIMRVSEWTIYSLIKSDTTFPFLNIGRKKKFVVDNSNFRIWLNDRACQRSFN